MVKKEKQIEMLYLMLKVRRVEESLLDIFAQGKIPGFIHKHWAGRSRRGSLFVFGTN